MQTAASSVRYQVVVVSILMSFILYLDRVCLGEIVKSESFLTETNFTKAQIGDLLASFFLTYALFQIPAGWASDRFGGRRMLTGYIVIWSLLTMITGMSKSFAQMQIARMGFGIAQAGAYPTSGGLIRNWFPVLGRGKASAFVTFGGRVGGALAPFLTAALLSTYVMTNLGGWRAVLVLYGIIGLFIAIAYWTFVRDRPADCDYCNEAERELIGVRPPEERPKLNEIPQLLWSCVTNTSLWGNSLGQFFVNIGWAYLITWLPTYLKEVKHVDPLEGSLMVTLVLSAGIIGQLLGGIVADQSIRHIGLRRGRTVPITVATTIAGAAYFLCPFVDSVWNIVALCWLVSLMTDLCNPSTWAFMQDIGGRNTSSIAGWGNMCGNFGAMVSSWMVPRLMDQNVAGIGGQQLVFMVCSGAFFLAALSALAMNPTKPLHVENVPAGPVL